MGTNSPGQNNRFPCQGVDRLGVPLLSNIKCPITHGLLWALGSNQLLLPSYFLPSFLPSLLLPTVTSSVFSRLYGARTSWWSHFKWQGTRVQSVDGRGRSIFQVPRMWVTSFLFTHLKDWPPVTFLSHSLGVMFVEWYFIWQLFVISTIISSQGMINFQFFSSLFPSPKYQRCS